MLNKLLNIVSSKYPVKGYNMEEFKSFKIKGITFVPHAYLAPGLGHVFIMSASGMFGLMKMDTFVITPFQKDLPLLSYDRIRVMKKDTLIADVFDTLLENQDMQEFNSLKDSLSDIPDRPSPDSWFTKVSLSCSTEKNGTKKNTAALDEFIYKFVDKYVALSMEMPECPGDEKKAKNSEYVEHLLSDGGISTEMFKKYIGIEKTSYFFRKFFFGTER